MTKQPAASRSKTGRSRQRFEHVNTFDDETMQHLTPAEIAVWLVLWREIRPPGDIAKISNRSIAAKAGISRRTVSAAIGSLEQRKLLTIVKRGNFNGTVAEYRVRGSTALY